MDTVTYPDARVVRFVTEHFLAVKINIRQPPARLLELTRRIKPVWAPMFVFLDPKGSELRRYTGWLPPEQFIAELTFVLAMQDLLRTRFESAYTRLRQITEDQPAIPLAAEALFWSGAAAYKREGGSFEALRPIWDELVRRYPGSTWATRASIWDMQDQ